MRSRAFAPIVLSGVVLVVAASVARGQITEVFTAKATVKGASGATASAPVRITVDRITPQDEVDKMAAVFKKDGAKGLRKALAALPRTGSVQLGNGEAVPTRITVDRSTPKGRVLTMITDKPVMFLGAGLPDAKPKEGYDFGVIQLQIDKAGSGSGTIAPAAKIRTSAEGSFEVEDYSSEVVQLGVVRKGK